MYYVSQFMAYQTIILIKNLSAENARPVKQFPWWIKTKRGLLLRFTLLYI